MELKEIENLYEQAMATMRIVRKESIAYLTQVLSSQEDEFDLSDYEVRLVYSNVTSPVLRLYLIAGEVYCDLAAFKCYDLQCANDMEIFEIAEAVKYLLAQKEEGRFIYPKVLAKSSEMYKQRKQISSDDTIFGGRKSLLDHHYAMYPIYLDASYYVINERLPMVERDGDDYKCSGWGPLSEWRDCHYYSLCEWEGHRFFIMSGGRYD